MYFEIDYGQIISLLRHSLVDMKVREEPRFACKFRRILNYNPIFYALLVER
jgi:hypothetical protein